LKALATAKDATAAPKAADDDEIVDSPWED
jgi:hypothetical protein